MPTNTSKRPQAQTNEEKSDNKKRYVAPKLTHLGSMSDHTLGKGGSNQDKGQDDFTRKGGL